MTQATCKPHALQSNKEDSQALVRGFSNYLVGKNPNQEPAEPHIPWLLVLDSLELFMMENSKH